MLTEKALFAQIRKRVESAARKKLIEKVGIAGRFFFEERHRPRYVSGIDAKTLHYDETSCTSSWEWTVTASAAVMGPFKGLLSEAKIILHYDLGHWGKDDCTVTLIHEDGTTQVVLAATTEGKLNAPEIVSGWFYGVYIPGKWERLLDGPTLEAISEKRKEATQQAAQREMSIMARNQAKSPASVGLQQRAFDNYGIGKSNGS